MVFIGGLLARIRHTVLKRQQLEVWRQYARTVTQLLQTNALQPAAQALRETGQIAPPALTPGFPMTPRPQP